MLSDLDPLVVVLDTKRRIVTFNRACELLTGNREEEVQGRLFHEVFLLPQETEQDGAVFDALRSGHTPRQLRNH